MPFEKPHAEELPTVPSSDHEDASASETPDERRAAAGAMASLVKSKFARLLLGASALMGAEQAAEAGGAERPAQKVEAKMADGKDVMYVADDLGEKTGKVGGRSMDYRLDFEGVFVHEEGDPSTDADDREVRASVTAANWEDGRTTYTIDVDYKNGGLKNPFAKIEYHPQFERDEIAGQPIEAWGLELESIGNEYWAVKGFEAAGKGDTPKAKHLRAELQKDLIEFQKKHPKAPIDKGVRDDVMGLK